MDKTISYLRILFHALTLSLIIFSLYPGSILGFILYGDLSSQPQVTRDFLFISTNHLYAYLFISLIGLFAYLRDVKFKMVFAYLFFLSIMLEVAHLLIPERNFEKSDLIGNILGVFIASMIVLIYKFWRK